MIDLDEVGVGWVELRVGGGGDAGEAFEEGLGGGVEVLIGDAEDSAGADGFEVMPVALVDDALERDAIPCSAPTEEEDVGVSFGDSFGGGVRARYAEILASGGFDQLGDPGLRVDEGFAPLFAVDTGGPCSLLGTFACGGDGGLHLGDEGFGIGSRIDVSGDEADVFIDVGDRVWREGEDGKAGFEDCGEGFHAVGDAGDDEISLCGEDFFGVGGPAVVEDVRIFLCQFG